MGKKVAIILDTFSIGGIETVALNYITLLKKKDYDIDVYVLNPSRTAMLSKLPEGVNYFIVNFNRLLCPELYSYGVMNWWWGKYAYSLIHPILLLLLKIRKICSKKREYDIAIAFSGHISDLTFLTEGFVKAKQKICWCHGSLLSYLAICDGYPKLYKKVDKIVTLSKQGLFNVYGGHKFLYEKKIMNIYNPVLIKEKNLNKGHVEELKCKYGHYVLMIARATYPKNHMTAIKAIELLHNKGIDINIVFLGDGENLSEYKEYAKNHALDGLCHFEGNRDDVNDYIEASYINLLASSFEGLPTVMIEAMAFSKPCIMTNSDGGEVTSNGKYGVLTEVDDYKEIADAIERLYFNETEYKRYAELSRQRFNDFNPEYILKQVEELFDS